MQVEFRVVLPEKPDWHIVSAERQNPHGFALADDMFDGSADTVIAKERILLLSVP